MNNKQELLYKIMNAECELRNFCENSEDSYFKEKITIIHEELKDLMLDYGVWENE